jgi:hypothetical protein
VLLVLLAATVVKLVWAAMSTGTSDAVTFFIFTESIRESGLIHLYHESALFNHTPLTGGFTTGLNWLAGGELAPFVFLLRLMCILADAGMVIALLAVRRKTGKPPWWALMLFAASPVSIMVSGFHGNVDPIMTLLLFLAAVACLDGRAVLCGLLFGLACNVKVAPLLFGPVFFFHWLARGKGWRFAAASGGLMLLGSAWPLLQCPEVYLPHVFGYSSSWGVWGITYWCMHTGAEYFQPRGFQLASPAQALVIQALKVIIIGGVGLVGWKRRAGKPEDIFTTLAMAWAVFFVFAPGVGVQYMVWGAPFILLFSARWYAVVTASSSLFLAMFYQSASRGGHFPWLLVFPTGNQASYWIAWGNVAWITFILVLVSAIRQYWVRREPVPCPA